MSFQPASAKWEASLFGSNITDERYYEECNSSRTGIYDYRYGNPDSRGLEFVARFCKSCGRLQYYLLYT